LFVRSISTIIGIMDKDLGLLRVSKEKREALREKMESLGIHEKDIVEKFVRSTGKGGQKVNTR